MTTQLEEHHEMLVSSITIVYQPSSNKSHSVTDSSGKGKQHASDNDNRSTSSYTVDLYSRLIGNMNQTRRYASEMALHERSIVELNPDGSILITPRPLSQPPNEIIEWILSYLYGCQKTLYQCTFVTKQFHEVANPLLWKTPISLRDGDSLDRFFTCISNASIQQTPYQPISNLALCHQLWTDTKLMCFIPYLSRLTHLQFHGRDTSVTNKDFLYLLHHVSDTLESLRLERTQLGHPSFSILAQHCRKLKHFDWNVSCNESPKWLRMLVGQCPLEHLKISFSEDRSLKDDDAVTAIKAFDRLASLEIRAHYPGLLHKLLLSPIDNNQHIPHWHNLTKLALEPCTLIDDTILETFITTHPRLQHIELITAEKLTDISLIAMRSLPDLTHLMIDGNRHMTSAGVRQLINCSYYLLSLKFNSCRISARDILVPQYRAMGMFGLMKSIRIRDTYLDRNGIKEVRQAIMKWQRWKQRQMARKAVAAEKKEL